MRFKYFFVLLLILFSVPFALAEDSLDFKIVSEPGYSLSNISLGSDYKFTVLIFNDSIQIDDLVVSAGYLNEDPVVLIADENGVYTFSDIKGDFKISVNLRPEYDLYLKIPTNAGFFSQKVVIKSFPYHISSLDFRNFKGWSVSEDESDIISDSVLTESDYLSLDEKSVYAIFNEIEKYNVKYVGIPSDPENKHVSVPQDNTDYEKNAYAYVKFDVIPEIRHSEFQGWATSIDAYYPDYTPGQVRLTKVTDNKTLYGIWEPGAHLVTYNLDGGESQLIPEDHISVHGMYLQLPKLPRSANKDGAKHIGWVTEGIQKTYMPGSNFQMINKSIEFKAIWETMEEPEPPITDDPETPIPDDPDTPIPDDPETPIPDDPDTPIPDDSETPIPDDPEEYISVTFKFENGQNDLVIKVLKNGTFSLPTGILRGGHVFVEWRTESGESINVSESNEVKAKDQNMTLIAKWDILPAFSEESEASIVDVILLMQYVSGIGPYADLDESEMMSKGFDLNSDNNINISDVILYLKSI
ncbi:MAG: hypothetical protein GX362_00260 [Methanosarcinaceae archaeon]|nr:hypothetical protein [Methanosarcinaceae archaeon]